MFLKSTSQKQQKPPWKYSFLDGPSENVQKTQVGPEHMDNEILYTQNIKDVQNVEFICRSEEYFSTAIKRLFHISLMIHMYELLITEEATVIEG